LTVKIRLHVWGARALFSRPEMKVERVSYDVITPSAARGILEAIHWKPAMVWRIQRLRVLKPIRFESIRRNEVGSKIPAGRVATAMRAGSTEDLALYVDEDRQQRAATVLRDVAYVIEAAVELTARGRADPSESVAKHVEMARRRAARGQCFHHPYLGTREFACDFALLEGDPPPPHESLLGERDLGWMALDIDFAAGMAPRFFRAVMRDGVIEVPALDGADVAG
jgi:CRISPR-associated protein Cas5d